MDELSSWPSLRKYNCRFADRHQVSQQQSSGKLPPSSVDGHKYDCCNPLPTPKSSLPASCRLDRLPLASCFGNDGGSMVVCTSAPLRDAACNNSRASRGPPSALSTHDITSAHTHTSSPHDHRPTTFGSNRHTSWCPDALRKSTNNGRCMRVMQLRK